MKKKGFFITCTAILWAVVFSVIMILCVQQPHFAPNCDDFTPQDGGKVSAIRFNELDGLSRVQYANFTPNEFVVPASLNGEEALPQGQLVELDKFVPTSQRGTYQFVVSHLNTQEENARQQFANGLDSYRSYDGYFHVTLFVPPVFGSAVIYADRDIVAKIGDIANYDFSRYNDVYLPETFTEHNNKTEGVYLDLKFSAQDLQSIPDGYEAGTLITIHYEADGNKLGGLRGVPLIGDYEDVHNYQDGITRFYVVILILAVIVFITIAFLCCLKKSVAFMPHLSVSFAGILLIASRIFLNVTTNAPYLWGALTMGATGLLAFAASISVRVKIRKFPLWTVTASLTGANSVINFIIAYLPPASFEQWHVYRIVVGIVLGAMIVVQTFLYIKQHPNRIYSCITPVLAAVFTAVLPFMSLYEMFYPTSPALYLFVTMIISTMIYSVFQFVSTERTNRYLTENLSGEVLRRTENLKNLVNERDRLLRYLSHDMKKPVASIKRFAGELMTTETDKNKKAQLQVICNKADSINKSLVELQKYAKLNFSPEQPQKYDVYDLLKDTYDELSPDCEASDIILHNNAKHILAYYRKLTLAQVLKNLVFNCIEHAECHNVYLSAQKSGDRCDIIVTDDGIGIDDAEKMFEAYTTGGVAENLGLGLYICRELVHDMGGELTYSREDDKTTFTVTLPLA